IDREAGHTRVEQLGDDVVSEPPTPRFLPGCAAQGDDDFLHGEEPNGDRSARPRRGLPGLARRWSPSRWPVSTVMSTAVRAPRTFLTARYFGDFSGGKERSSRVTTAATEVVRPQAFRGWWRVVVSALPR